MTEKKRALILCTGNSARSQMAEGLLRELGAGQFEVESAGIAPSAVRPEAVEAMREIGINLSFHHSKSVEKFAGQNFDYVITVCNDANETCPVFSSTSERIHHRFTDPPPETVGDYQARLKVFRTVRDQMREWLISFVQK